MKFSLNALSANGQCHSPEECFDSIQTFVKFIEYCLPAIENNRIKIFYDSLIESRQLRKGEHFKASINSCKSVIDGKDLVDKWYLFTRNRTEELPCYREVEVHLTATGTALPAIHGTISDFCHQTTDCWISLPGDSICDCHNLNFDSPDLKRNGKNHTEFEHLRRELPIYEPSEKHRKETYEAGGEKISAMPLDDSEAQKLLLTSIAHDNEKKLWAFHRQSKTYYCFQRTFPDKKIYHGYQETPPEYIEKTIIA